MDKRIVLITLFSIAAHHALGQAAPVIEWQRCLGGTSSENFPYMQPLADGGCIVMCSTQSNDGDVTGNNGYIDTWVVRLDADGEIVWQDCFGGSGQDAGRHIYPTADGGSFIAGKSYSTDGDVGENNGATDLWAFKLGPNGDLQWESSFGGGTLDNAEAGIESLDGQFLAVGHTQSQDGDVAGFIGGASDAWAVRMDAAGELVWQLCCGGSASEKFEDIERTADGGFVMVGWTASNDSDVVGNHGGQDAWVVKINALGTIQWQRCIGGSGSEGADAVTAIPGGGFIVGGVTNSIDGDFTGTQPGVDGWVAQLDPDGEIVWVERIGGSGSEFIVDARPCSDSGIVLGGYSTSTDNGFNCVSSGSSAWIAKLSDSGSLLWQLCLGGEGDDSAWAAAEAADGGYYAIIQSSSTTGNVTCNQGGYDAWLIKLRPDPTGLLEPSSTTDLLVVPNPTDGPVAIEFTLDEPTTITLNWFDASGRILVSEPQGLLPSGVVRIGTSTPGTAPGIYVLRIETPKATTSYRVVRMP